MTVDISDTIAPKSDQLDAVDLVSGDRTFTITGVSRGNDEQPVQFALADFPRVWRPGLSMRRVLVACWGRDASTYVGRRVTLYCDPDVQFGGAAVGGTRIRALSHIDKPKAVPLLVKRGKSAMFTVKPLADAPAPTRQPAGPTAEELISAAQLATTNEALDRIARQAGAGLKGNDLETVKEIVTARREELRKPVEDEPTLDGWPATAEIPS